MTTAALARATNAVTIKAGFRRICLYDVDERSLVFYFFAPRSRTSALLFGSSVVKVRQRSKIAPMDSTNGQLACMSDLAAGDGSDVGDINGRDGGRPPVESRELHFEGFA